MIRKSIFSRENLAHKVYLDNLESNIKELIGANTLFIKRNKFVGYVERDSNINKINFTILIDFEKLESKLTEGSVFESPNI